jgi:hypothetical protein
VQVARFGPNALSLVRRRASEALPSSQENFPRFGIGNNGSRSQSEALTAPPAARSRCPCEVRWPTPARALSGASGRLRSSYGAPGRDGDKKIASAVVRLWVAGRRSGRAIVARGIGLFPLAAAATA